MFEDPAACEREFYRAFESCDLAAMMAVWASRAPLLCVHPTGPPLTARGQVEDSWRAIFDGGGGGMRFTLSDLREVTDGGVCVRFVHENIHHGPGLRTTSLVLASNVYVFEDDGWRICMHHACPGAAPEAVARGGASTVH